MVGTFQWQLITVSLLHYSCPLLGKGGFIKKLPLLSAELIHSEEREKQRGNHK